MATGSATIGSRAETFECEVCGFGAPLIRVVIFHVRRVHPEIDLATGGIRENLPGRVEVATRSAPPLPRVAKVALIVAILVTIGAFLLIGEVQAALEAGLNVLPFVVLCVLAYAGVDRPWARTTTKLWVGLLVGGIAVLSLALVVDVLGIGGEEYASLSAEKKATASAAMLAVLAAASTALVLRSVARRRFPGDEGYVARVALAFVGASTCLLLVPLLILGEPPVLAMLARGDTVFGEMSRAQYLRQELYGLCWAIPAAVFAVGYGYRRGLRDCLDRLGVSRLDRSQVVLALALSIALVGVGVLVGEGIEALWQRLDWPVTDEASLRTLFAHAIHPVGALVVSLVAGVGEELSVRGILQPRLGIATSNLFFTSLHAFQYGWDVLLVVFLGGAVLGVIRRRWSTSLSAAVHGLYDFILFMALVLGITS